ARFDREVFDIPGGAARIRLGVEGLPEWDAVITDHGADLVPAGKDHFDAKLVADEGTWEQISANVGYGMSAFSDSSLRVRHNLHLGVGFLAATSGIVDPGRMEFAAVKTPAGKISTLTAGQGDPVVCLHGLGATKASFLTTIEAMSGTNRVIAVDLPGFGDSDKPLDAPYNAAWFAGTVIGLLDELGIDRAHLVGNSMGGRVAIEAGLLYPERIRSTVLLAPALAWLKDRRWRWLLRGPLPKLGLIQPAPRVITEPLVRGLVPGGKEGWTAAGIDEFLRSFLTPRGRVAFYEAARNIYMDEPHGEEGLWTRLAGLSPPALFVWGRKDTLVPIGFRKHVERVLPQASHLELECGHVPQMEEPLATHEEMSRFYSSLD
ncbi:MAG: alpha/beta fold hydrolase, partial [Solirubrobacterales bacterium]